MLQVGMLVDNRYKILRVLGRGGSSCVFLAENIRIHNYWAIKEVYKTGRTSPGNPSNALLAESSILTKLRHPGLPTIVDVIETPQAYLIVMEYIEGVSLDKLLQQKGAQPEQVVLQWAKQLCDVLQYLHARTPAIIYRDMKPANIMLKPNGSVTLIDFGVAREYKPNHARDTVYFGTHGYAAPEQYNGSGQTDARTDIYSLGVTLYHLVTGMDPCRVGGIPPARQVNPAVSMRFEQILQTCMQLSPNKRYQSVTELRQALETVMPSSASVPSAVSYTVKPVQPVRREKKSMLGLLALIPVGLLLIGVILAFALSGNSSPTPEEEYAYDVLTEDQYIVLEAQNDIYVLTPDQRFIFGFIPETSGVYRFYSDCETGAPVIWLCDENDNVLTEANTRGTYSNFDFTYELQAGQLYYLNTTLYDLSEDLPATGHYVLYAEYVGEPSAGYVI